MVDREQQSRRTPILAVLTLSLVLVVLGLWSAALAEPTILLADLPPLLAVPALAALFVLARRANIHVDVRGQTLSLSLSDLPIVLGVVTLPPAWLLVIAVLAGATDLYRRHLPWHRHTCNLAFLVAEIGVGYLVAGRLLDPAQAVMANALPLLCVGLASSVVGAAAVLAYLVLVRAWPGGKGMTGLVGAVAISALLGSSIGVLIAAALDSPSQPGGYVMALTATAGIALGYLAYARLAREHANLGEVLDSVQAMGATRTTADLIIHLTEQASALVKAQHAEVWLPGVPSLEQALPTSGSEAVVMPADTRDPDQRRWLAKNGFRDALLLPIEVDGIEEGVLVVHDRTNSLTTFEVNDLHLLQTLVTHATTVWSNMNLLNRLRHEASHDVLTGLPNRAAFVQVVEQFISDCGPERRPLAGAVLFLDLDRFKDVNDALGHTVGDRLLVHVADRLDDVTTGLGLLARFGGDEFAVLMPEPGTVHDVERLADQISQSLVPPFTLGGSIIDVSASIGLTALFRDGDDAASLLRRADIAMSVAKRTRRPFAWSTPEDDRGSIDRLNLVGHLRRAIDEEQIALEFQPQECLLTGQVKGFEALARWTHPERGPIAPEEFIPLADHTGQVGVLTTHALRLALRECARWDPALSVSVNLPGRLLLEPGLPAQIAREVDAAGVDPSRVIMELTEDSLMTYHRETLGPLQALRDHGLQLSIDDFGTGYSSLAYLRRLPVQEIKIDKSFMTGITSTPDAASLVRAIVDLAHVLKLLVVAEGVEDVETLALLRSLGVDLAQGFHIARPMPAGLIPGWLATHPTA